MNIELIPTFFYPYDCPSTALFRLGQITNDSCNDDWWNGNDNNDLIDLMTRFDFVKMKLDNALDLRDMYNLNVDFTLKSTDNKLNTSYSKYLEGSLTLKFGDVIKAKEYLENDYNDFGTKESFELIELIKNNDINEIEKKLNFIKEESIKSLIIKYGINEL